MPPRRPPPKPKRRPPGTGSVGTRKDGRLFCTLPPDLDASRKPHYGPGNRRAFASIEQATAWLDAEIVRLRTPATLTASASEPLGAYLARWFRNTSPGWPERTLVAYRGHLRRWQHIGHVPLGSLTREIVQGAVADLQRATWQRRRQDGTPSGEPRPPQVDAIRSQS